MPRAEGEIEAEGVVELASCHIRRRHRRERLLRPEPIGRRIAFDDVIDAARDARDEAFWHREAPHFCNEGRALDRGNAQRPASNCR
jgi:hypothetical protein